MSQQADRRPVRVLAVPCDDFACGQWRVIQPFSAMRDPRVEVAFPQQGQADLSRVDVAVFQRTLWPGQLPVLRQLKAAGKRVVIDYDDAFPITDPELPDYATYAPGSPNAAALAEALSLADAVLVSTPELAAHYSAAHPRVVLAPNAVDLAGPLFVPGPYARLTPRTTLFWSGWTSHEPNLRLVVAPVMRLLTERDDVALAVCGPKEFCRLFDSDATRGKGKVFHVPPVPFAEFMRVASVADVALAPLRLTGFNDAKSEIRLIEAAAWGVPAVASPTAPYRRFEGGEGACLLAEANAGEAWHAALRQLVDDPAARRAIGQRARGAASRRYDLAGANLARADLLASLA